MPVLRRATSVSTLMYVKEDLIIPHHISFYDLISTKARGKSGPLFHFDVHEDIRTQSDARIEKDESHAGVCVCVCVCACLAGSTAFPLALDNVWLQQHDCLGVHLIWGLAHAGKIVDRHWYNRNKHIFPASRWEDYNPDRVFDLYTTHGTEVKIWNGIM